MHLRRSSLVRGGLPFLALLGALGVPACTAASDDGGDTRSDEISTHAASELLDGDVQVLGVVEGHTYATQSVPAGAWVRSESLLRIPLAGGAAQVLGTWSRPISASVLPELVAASTRRLHVLRASDADPARFELATIDFASGETTTIPGSTLLPGVRLEKPLGAIGLAIPGCNLRRACDEHAPLVVFHEQESAIVRDVATTARIEAMPGANDVFGFPAGAGVLLCRGKEETGCTAVRLPADAPAEMGKRGLPLPARRATRGTSETKVPPHPLALLSDLSYFAGTSGLWAENVVRVWPFDADKAEAPLPATDTLAHVAEGRILAIRNNAHFVVTDLGTGTETTFPPFVHGRGRFEEIVSFPDAIYLGTGTGLLRLDLASGTQEIVPGTNGSVYSAQDLPSGGVLFSASKTGDGIAASGLVLVRPGAAPVATGPLVVHNSAQPLRTIVSADGAHVYGAVYRAARQCLLPVAGIANDALTPMAPVLAAPHVDIGDRGACLPNAEFIGFRPIPGSPNVLAALRVPRPRDTNPTKVELRVVMP